MEFSSLISISPILYSKSAWHYLSYTNCLLNLPHEIVVYWRWRIFTISCCKLMVMAILYQMTSRYVPGIVSSVFCTSSDLIRATAHGAGTVITAIVLLQLRSLRGARRRLPWTTQVADPGIRAAPGPWRPQSHLEPCATAAHPTPLKRPGWRLQSLHFTCFSEVGCRRSYPWIMKQTAPVTDLCLLSTQQRPNGSRMEVFDLPTSLVTSLFQIRWNAGFHTSFFFF